MDLSTAAAERFVRFIRLGSLTEVRDGQVSFPPGVLWPYTADLRRVRAAFDASDGRPTAPLLAAVGALHERIAFAPGGARGQLAALYDEMSDALARGPR